ncbi:hypothetical protein OXIME_000375 [Oxyplasma meridianum]|uniref:Uncharacterized protein n=1 Tax=Oxyplasma meridianum TaxID=3073602 RepID=A0AAX4NEC3_9ARCH
MTDGEKIEENETTDNDKKNISVKGVSKNLYNRVLNIARDSGKTLGEITDDAYSSIVATVDGALNVSKAFVEGTRKGTSRIIENIKNLDLTEKDLSDIGQRVTIRNVVHLVLKDMSDSAFNSGINLIVHVNELEYADTIKKSSILLKSKFVDHIACIKSKK